MKGRDRGISPAATAKRPRGEGPAECPDAGTVTCPGERGGYAGLRPWLARFFFTRQRRLRVRLDMGVPPGWRPARAAARS